MLTPANLHTRHSAKKEEIEARLSDFALIAKQGDKVLLSELSFCISAANSSAEAASRAQKELDRRQLLSTDNTDAISSVLLSSHVRFHKNKARYIIEARKNLFDERKLGQAITTHPHPIALRNHLADEVLGLGMKEAGHFLRNTGIANEFAILDRHILANLVSLGVIDEAPRHLTKKNYLQIEEKMLKFCQKNKIPAAHIDLLMWSEQTGRIFK